VSATSAAQRAMRRSFAATDDVRHDGDAPPRFSRLMKTPVPRASAVTWSANARSSLTL